MTTIGASPATWRRPARSVPERAGWIRLTRRGWIALTVLPILMVAAIWVGLGGIALSGGADRPGVPDAGTSRSDEPVLSVVVEQGDSLWAIAAASAPDGDPRQLIDRIKQRNGLSSNVLQPGQVLLVPVRP